MKIFGIEHLIVLAVFIAIIVASVILSKKYLKTDKQRTIYLKVIAGLLFIAITANRIALSLLNDNTWAYLLPTSLCGLSSLLISLTVLFGKPNMKSYLCFWYMAFGGGLITMVYPDFFPQTTNFFQFNICTGYFHHAISVWLCITMLSFGWFKPDFKKCYYFPMMFCVYIVLGAFEWHVFNIVDAMNLTRPLLNGTPLDIWFIWIVSSILVVLISFVYEVVTKKLKKRNLVEG